jgi:flagellar hook-associated protein 2
MAQIASSVGLISGINTSQIIDQLMSLEEQPVTDLQNRVDTANKQKLAYTDLQTRLASLRVTGQTLEKPSSFQTSSATSSNENVLTATTTNGAPVGDYQFQVAQLASTQQSVSQGFADATQSLVGAGTLTLEQGGGELTSSARLDTLNGGTGVARGQFRITDKSGQTGIIDLSGAVTVDDAIKKINTSLDVSVTATLGPNGLVISDTSGGSGNLVITDVAGGKTAANLGIVGNTNTTSITGTNVNYLGSGTLVSQLNDGLGIRNASTGADFAVTTGDGSVTNVTLGKTGTLGDVVNAINAAGGSKFHAVIPPNSNSIKIVDDTGGGGTFAVAALGSSKAAADLGILQTGASGTITGDSILTALGTVSIQSLNGGNGLTLGDVNVTNSLGNSATVHLGTAQNVNDILAAFNNAGIGVTASLNDSKNGIEITDNAGGTQSLTIGDADATNSATQLGINGTFAGEAVSGANLQRQWINENTVLSSYNGGKGVALGQFIITNPNNTGAQSYTVDLTTGNPQTIGDVISAINTNNVGVKASINAHGDGIVLSDTTGGGAKISTAESGSTTAADLNILGSGDTNDQIDGTFEKTVTLTSSDTLSSAQQKINALGAGVTASIINDGSAQSPFRLSITANNSGVAGRVVIDSGTTSLGISNLVNSTDSAVFIGSADAAKPLLITSNGNTISGAIPGVSIQLHGTSSDPVDLNITRDPSKLIDQLNTFVTNFNDTISKINDLTSFDSSTNTAGLLLGDSAVQQVQQNLYTAVEATVKGVGKYSSFAQVGLTIGDGATLSFDPDVFTAAYNADPDSVQKLFTAFQQTKVVTPTGGSPGDPVITPFGTDPTGTTPATDSSGNVIGSQTVTLQGFGLGYSIDNQISQLIDPTNGIITQENSTLDQQTSDYQDRITELNDLLADKRNRLEEQFANMETVLAGLQSQGNALSSLSGVSASTSSSKSTTSK